MISSWRELGGIVREMLMQCDGSPAPWGGRPVFAAAAGAGIPRPWILTLFTGPSQGGEKNSCREKNFSCASRLCTVRNCDHYLGGAIGERVCLRGFWNEGDNKKKPLLTAEAVVIRPGECKPGMEKI